MTKHDWKYGDVGVYRGIYSHMSHLINSKVRVTQIVVPFGLVNVQFPDGSIYTVDPESLSPAESLKDPFAPGEYVTCVERGCARIVGDTVRVSGPHSMGHYYFTYVPFGENLQLCGAEKSHFRPATPEEIAEYKAKYEAGEECSEPTLTNEGSVGCESDEEPRITFTVGGQEFYVGQRVWSLESDDEEHIKVGDEFVVSGAALNEGERRLAIRRPESSAHIFALPKGISTTPPVPHEWKRGDWARHEKKGVGFVCFLRNGYAVMSFNDRTAGEFLPSELTFISHSEPPE